jgi:hypothetical protein
MIESSTVSFPHLLLSILPLIVSMSLVVNAMWT